MVVVLIKTTLRSDADRTAYSTLEAEMFELVQTMPGFLGANSYTSAEGEEIGIVRFESLETLRAWREHPDHLVTQQRGRTEFYASLAIEVCEVVRSYGFTHPND